MSLVTGWCVVELMGHVRLVGELSEIDQFGTKMGCVEVLNSDGSRVTQLFGGGSVYRITPTTEEAARKLVAPYQPHRLTTSRYEYDEYVPDEETIPATFSPRSDGVRFNAHTDESSNIADTPLERGGAYYLEAFTLGDLKDPWNGARVQVGQDGLVEIQTLLGLAPDTEYHFVATKVEAGDPLTFLTNVEPPFVGHHVHFNAFTDEHGDVIETPLASMTLYEFVVLSDGKDVVRERWWTSESKGVYFAEQSPLLPSTEYHFEATVVESEAVS